MRLLLHLTPLSKKVYSTSLLLSNNPNDGEQFYYNDFGDEDFFLGDEMMSSPSQDTSPNINSVGGTNQDNSLLSDLISQSREKEQQNQARLSRNWSNGNWNVRGFSLDNSNPLDMARQQVETDEKKEMGMNSRSGNGNFEQLATDAYGNNLQQNAEPLPIHVCQMTFLKNANSEDGVDDDRLSIDVGSSGGRAMMYDSSTNEADLLAVGRTDGTVYFISLGTQYLTNFEARPSVKAIYDSDDGKDGFDSSSEGGGSGLSFQVEMELVRQDQQQSLSNDVDRYQSGDHDEFTEESNPMSGDGDIPFEILQQFRAHEPNEPITALLYQSKKLYTAGGSSGSIKAWSIIEDEDTDGNSHFHVQLALNLHGAHSGKVLALKTLSSSSGGGRRNDLLLSVSDDGSIALWDNISGDLVYSCHAADEYGSPIEIKSADVDTSNDNHLIYLGLANGYVVGYVAAELIQHASVGGDICPTPNLQYLAHDCSSSSENFNNGEVNEYDGVTAIVCNGRGTLSPSSSSIITGGADGSLKQWEIIGRRVTNTDTTYESSYWKLEQWPRLSTQRLKGKVHIFEGHFSPITSLQCVRTTENNEVKTNDRIFSAGLDGTIRIWDASSGKELYRMDGFTHGVSSLCLDSNTLVTNGMGEYVCVHDFDIDEDLEVADFTEEDFNW